MWMMVPFILNSLLNFIVSLLVAKFLGPAEYGRFVLAVTAGIVLQTLLLDWLRLSATRFYSDRDRVEQPQIRSTIDAAFGVLTALATASALALYFLRIDIALTHDLVALAVGVGVSNALFDTSTALLRARFHDKAYGVLVIGKNLLALLLTVGGAILFRSANIALVGMMMSVIGALVAARRELIDPNARFALADHRLAVRFLAYGIPIVLANFLYQTVPLANRMLTSQINGFAEVGQISLAFEIGIRIVGAIGSALDALLFQIAVRAEKDHGVEAAHAQVSYNLGVVFAVVLPTIAGAWLVLPSFESLLVPENFRGPFAHYFTLLTPALFAFAMINYSVNTVFQISHRLSPLIIAALVAVVANFTALLILPATQDATRFAIAQSISSCGGLAALIAMLSMLPPLQPRWRDFVGASVGVAIMVFACAPLRQWTPGLVTLLTQVITGAVLYGAIAFIFDIGGLRRALASKVLNGLRRA